MGVLEAEHSHMQWWPFFFNLRRGEELSYYNMVCFLVVCKWKFGAALKNWTCKISKLKTNSQGGRHTENDWHFTHVKKLSSHCLAQLKCLFGHLLRSFYFSVVVGKQCSLNIKNQAILQAFKSIPYMWRDDLTTVSMLVKDKLQQMQMP